MAPGPLLVRRLVPIVVWRMSWTVPLKTGAGPTVKAHTGSGQDTATDVYRGLEQNTGDTTFLKGSGGTTSAQRFC